MYTQNQYRKNSKLSVYISKKIIRCFADDMTALATARETTLTTNTIDDWFMYMREAIAWYIQHRPVSFFAKNNHLLQGMYTSIHKHDTLFIGSDFFHTYIQKYIMGYTILNRSVYVHAGEKRTYAPQYHNTSTDMSQEYIDFVSYILENSKKYKGIPTKTCALHIKEWGLKFACRLDDIDVTKYFLKVLRTYTLFH